MENYLQLKLESERIKLIPISKKYTKDICIYFTVEITKYMWPSAPKTEEEINNHIAVRQEKMRNNENISLLIINKKADEFLGYISLDNAHSNTPELGIWLKKSAHGFGYGYEALQRFKTWIENNLNYDYIKYPVDKKNTSSRKLAEKLGGKVEDAYIKESESGNILDELEYRIYKDIK